jgi:hypothetical protein
MLNMMFFSYAQSLYVVRDEISCKVASSLLQLLIHVVLLLLLCYPTLLILILLLLTLLILFSCLEGYAYSMILNDIIGRV